MNSGLLEESPELVWPNPPSRLPPYTNFSLFTLLLLVSSFAAVIIATASRCHHLTIFYDTSHNKLLSQSSFCLRGTGTDVPAVHLFIFSSTVWAPHPERLLALLYSREGRHLLKTRQLTPKQSRHINSTTGKGKLCSFDLGVNCPFKDDTLCWCIVGHLLRKPLTEYRMILSVQLPIKP